MADVLLTAWTSEGSAGVQEFNRALAWGLRKQGHDAVIADPAALEDLQRDRRRDFDLAVISHPTLCTRAFGLSERIAVISHGLHELEAPISVDLQDDNVRQWYVSREAQAHWGQPGPERIVPQPIRGDRWNPPKGKLNPDGLLLRYTSPSGHRQTRVLEYAARLRCAGAQQFGFGDIDNADAAELVRAGLAGEDIMGAFAVGRCAVELQMAGVPVFVGDCRVTTPGGGNRWLLGGVLAQVAPTAMGYNYSGRWVEPVAAGDELLAECVAQLQEFVRSITSSRDAWNEYVKLLQQLGRLHDSRNVARGLLQAYGLAS